MIAPLPFIPSEDPALPLPSMAEMERAARENPEEFRAYLADRQARIAAREDDPFHHGYEPAIWGVVDDLLVTGKRVILIDPANDVPREIIGGSEVYISGGNRSSKSEYAASRLMKLLVAKKNARAWAFHTTGPSSIAMQQPRVWKYMPKAWKQIRKHKIADIKWGQKNGFAGITPTFVGPNGSQCWFKNYAQGLNTIEGEELDFAWFDELVPMDFIEATRFRLATRKGVLIITFTAVEGYTATVKELCQDARDILKVDAKLLPVTKQIAGVTYDLGFEQVPRVQQAAYEDLKIVYFHIFDNPFGGREEVVKKASAGGRNGILLRCYGVPTKAIGAQFPSFRKDVHVITTEQVKALASHGTNYHIADPCSGRNFCQIWGRVLPDETILIYREWPSPGVYIQGVGDPGHWAESDGNKPDGKRGPAQSPWGFGHVRNMEEILRAEGWTTTMIEAAIATANCFEPAPALLRALPSNAKPPEKIWMRIIDSRYGNAPTLTRNETKTLIDCFNELGMDFEPSPGEHIEEGIDAVNTLLYYDPDQPIGPNNKPRLVIAENCKNLIWALENWTGKDGKHGACKDPIDVLRYLALSAPAYMDDEILTVKRGGSY